jgi:tetratricopeptide (TPR) repeat protein
VATTDFIAHMVIADSLVQTARPKEALSEWRQMLAAYPGNHDVQARLAVYEAANGDTLPLRRLIRESEKPTAYVAPWLIAWYYSQLGDVHSALKFLERAANERDSDVISVRWDPVCEHLRHEEAYQRVLKTIGM